MQCRKLNKDENIPIYGTSNNLTSNSLEIYWSKFIYSYATFYYS